MLQWCHCKSFLPQFCVKHAFPCSQSEFTCFQLRGHCLPFHWASEIPGVVSSSVTAPTVLADAVRSQPVFFSYLRSFCPPVYQRLLKILVKSDRGTYENFNGSKICSTNIFGAEPNARFNVQNFYVPSISFFCSRAFSTLMIICPSLELKVPS